MIGTRSAKAIAVALVIAALAYGGAAAARSAFLIQVHARLAPVAGTKVYGRFTGGLAGASGGITPFGKQETQSGTHWQLTWRLSRPVLTGSVTASLRVAASNGFPRVVRVLCTQCSTKATGTVALTASEVMRIARAKAAVVVQTSSAKLRGPLKPLFLVQVPTKS
jgi:hypothetical protein